MVGSFRRLLLSGLLVLIFVFSADSAFSQTGDASPATDTEVRNSLRRLTEIYSIVEQNYAEPVNADKAIYSGAIPRMLHVLDPHSNFFDPRAYSAMREDQRGRYYGVGMQIVPRNNKIIVVAPFEGTPAYRAGIKPGDTIIAVDGKLTENMAAGEVADSLKGPRGSTVHISILRDKTEKPIDFAVVRDEIPRPSVDLKFEIAPGIGYLRVTAFNENTGREVKTALDELGDLKGLILDLRGNPGGLLNEAVSVADKFLKRGQIIVSQHGRRSPERVFRATRGNSGREYPLVVLMNKGSASASEIVAGTIAKYYTPSGRLIQRDYAGRSLYDYYYNPDSEEALKKDARLTDVGRTVYSGGGIVPDVKIPQPKATRFRDNLLQHYAFFNFSRAWLADHPADRSFVVTDDVVGEFRKFLADEKIVFTENEFNDNLFWIKSQIKADIFVSQYGQESGLRVRAENDPQVMEALKLLPKARELEEKASKVVAQRSPRNVPTER